MLVWILLVSMVGLFFLLRSCFDLRKHSPRSHSTHAWVEMGSDEEILYCPGDEKGDGHDEY